MIDAIRFVEYTHLSSTTTNEVLARWPPGTTRRAPTGAAGCRRTSSNTCAELAIEIVYLDTVLDSSTALLEGYSSRRDRNGD